ncbi:MULTISPECIES: GNAT family N-acetyltransferase [unclassified Thioalkalivibrio]|uniref:GNAT family N-acetyltransferase n=1 Tax=unclassified Thioalkalivibrio TaxID=2621013 RepID=UPI00036FDB86|nr:MULTISPECIES: GNAT family N-acetyltransferase [unclassified Thioalkalivibrio]
MEQLAYQLKHRLPWLFRGVEAVARGVTVLRFGGRIRRARRQGTLQGRVAGEPAVMRPLGVEDLDALSGFLSGQPEERLQYFRPHGFDHRSLRRVLASGAFLNYGLFAGDRLVGYALLKVAPTGSAFIGLLVHPDFAGMGLGRFIVQFLYWQASRAGLRARSTISRHNPASLRSHEAVAKFEIVAELPNDYLLIEFPPGRPETPVLAAG